VKTFMFSGGEILMFDSGVSELCTGDSCRYDIYDKQGLNTV
jgi:hypothetical protein